MKKLRILVSGGTGFLGNYVVPLLKPFADITLISRSSTSSDALRADLSKWDGGIDPEKLKGQFDIFLHMAGLYNLRINQVEAMKHNIFGTHVALTIAQKAEIPHFVNTSTIAVTLGDSSFAVPPEKMDTSKSFPDYYAFSKGYAENMVRLWEADAIKSKLNLRLGILVGSTNGDPILRIDGPYHAFQAGQKLSAWINKYPGKVPLPGNSKVHLPIVPVDTAAKAIARLLQISREKEWSGYKSLYVCKQDGVTANELYRSVFDFCGMNRKKFILVNAIPKVIIKKLSEMLADLPQEEVEYLLKTPRLDCSETEKLLGESWCPSFKKYEKEFWAGYEKYLQNS